MFDPEITRDGALVPQFEWGRGAPASIVVNRKGERFANEALPYNDFPKAFGSLRPGRDRVPERRHPRSMIFDQHASGTAQRILSMHPGPARSRLGAPKADTIGELAERDRHRPRRARGDGRPVQRARRATARTPTSGGTNGRPDVAGAWWRRSRRRRSTRSRSTPACSAPTAGRRLDADGQVRRRGGGVVGGLYAAGNTAANVFGWAYPSGGGTLGNGIRADTPSHDAAGSRRGGRAGRRRRGRGCPVCTSRTSRPSYVQTLQRPWVRPRPAQMLSCASSNHSDASKRSWKFTVCDTTPVEIVRCACDSL